jgi:hypothetical protein
VALRGANPGSNSAWDEFVARIERLASGDG